MEPAADTQPRTYARAPLDRHGSPAGERPDTATTPGYASTFPGRTDQARQVRREITAYLAGCPAAADIILIASELAANAIMHTQSRGSTFTVRCHASPGQARIEVEDLGGPWRPRPPGDRPHGLDIVQALADPGGWGTKAADTGGRTVWAQLTW